MNLYYYFKNNVINFFFFSSRRRHTRLTGDWSSDVCSSDLWRKLGRNRRTASSAFWTSTLASSSCVIRSRAPRERDDDDADCCVAPDAPAGDDAHPGTPATTTAAMINSERVVMATSIAA